LALANGQWAATIGALAQNIFSSFRAGEFEQTTTPGYASFAGGYSYLALSEPAVINDRSAKNLNKISG
jgi:hypothetical protein